MLHREEPRPDEGTAPAGREGRGPRPPLPELTLTVVDARDLHPGLRRVILACPGGVPDYRPGQDLVLMLPTGAEAEDGTPELGRRHYTIRDSDRAAGTLAVDVVMHGDTPGPRFARRARPGDRVTARGPRGRTALRDEGPHLMVGDETALPAILHMLETMPAEAEAHAIIEVADAGWEVAVDTPGRVRIDWVHRNGPPQPSTLLLDHLKAGGAWRGHGTAYVLAETSVMRSLRHHLEAEGVARAQLVCEGYWRPGRLGGHDHI